MARTANHLASTPGLASSLGPLAIATRGTASTQVYDAVRAAIVRGILPPGTAMSEVEIGEMLHVSRTPVRETFRRLAAEGLLTVAPQVGTTVRKMSRQVLADALFIRETIECGAARLAVLAPEADRRAVLDIVRRQREAIGRNDVEGGLDRDEDLHKAIIDLSGHPGAWEPVRQARTHMERVRRMAIPALQSNTKALDQHEIIVAALVEGDTEALVASLRNHILLIESFVDGLAARYPDYFE